MHVRSHQQAQAAAWRLAFGAKRSSTRCEAPYAAPICLVQTVQVGAVCMHVPTRLVNDLAPLQQRSEHAPAVIALTDAQPSNLPTNAGFGLSANRAMLTR